MSPKSLTFSDGNDRLPHRMNPKRSLEDVVDAGERIARPL